jgi:hypothetical protein
MTVSVPQSLTVCPQQLELNHIIASILMMTKKTIYELRVKFREI